MPCPPNIRFRRTRPKSAKMSAIARASISKGGEGPRRGPSGGQRLGLRGLDGDRFAAAASRSLVRIFEDELRGIFIAAIIHARAKQEQHRLRIDKHGRTL